jgi:hypothetical protein
MPIEFKDITEVLKNLRRGRSGLKLCPVCQSSELEVVSSLSIGLTPTQYICKKCGYTGPLFIEIEKDNNQETK